MIIYTSMAAISSDEICFSRTDNEEYDVFEPFSSVSFYTHGNTEPSFYFVNLEQYVVSITTFVEPKTGAEHFVTLSAEGEITIFANGNTRVEQIPSAGLVSDADTSKHGRLETVRQIGSSLFSCGASGQVYYRSPDGNWGLLTDRLLSSRREISDYYRRIPNFGEFRTTRDWHDWMTKNPLPLENHLNDLNGVDERNVYLLDENGRIFFWNGESVVEVYRDANQSLTRVLVDLEGCVWVCGHNGVLLKGNNADGFQQVYGSDTQMFLSMVEYRGDLYLCSNIGPSGLFRWDQSTEKPELLSTPTVEHLHTIAVVDDVMWVAGLKDILRFDGSVWDHIYLREFSNI